MKYYKPTLKNTISPGGTTVTAVMRECDGGDCVNLGDRYIRAADVSRFIGGYHAGFSEGRHSGLKDVDQAYTNGRNDATAEKSVELDRAKGQIHELQAQLAAAEKKSGAGYWDALVNKIDSAWRAREEELQLRIDAAIAGEVAVRMERDAAVREKEDIDLAASLFSKAIGAEASNNPALEAFIVGYQASLENRWITAFPSGEFVAFRRGELAGAAARKAVDAHDAARAPTPPAPTAVYCTPPNDDGDLFLFSAEAHMAVRTDGTVPAELPGDSKPWATFKTFADAKAFVAQHPHLKLVEKYVYWYPPPTRSGEGALYGANTGRYVHNTTGRVGIVSGDIELGNRAEFHTYADACRFCYKHGLFLQPKGWRRLF